MGTADIEINVAEEMQIRRHRIKGDWIPVCLGQARKRVKNNCGALYASGVHPVENRFNKGRCRGEHRCSYTNSWQGYRYCVHVMAEETADGWWLWGA